MKKVPWRLPGLVAIATQLATDHLQRSLPSLGDLTMRFSEFLLRLGYDDVVVDQTGRTLGTSGFQVEVRMPVPATRASRWSACSWGSTCGCSGATFVFPGYC